MASILVASARAWRELVEDYEMLRRSLIVEDLHYPTRLNPSSILTD